MASKTHCTADSRFALITSLRPQRQLSRITRLLACLYVRFSLWLCSALWLVGNRVRDSVIPASLRYVHRLVEV